MINIQKSFLVNRQIDVVNIDREKAMMDLDKGNYYTLNEVGSVIFDMIQKERTVLDIINKLALEYEVDFNICKNEVLLFIEDLIKKEIVA